MEDSQRNYIDELFDIKKLLDAGIITEEEFNKQKQIIINNHNLFNNSDTLPPDDDQDQVENKQIEAKSNSGQEDYPDTVVNSHNSRRNSVIILAFCAVAGIIAGIILKGQSGSDVKLWTQNLNNIEKEVYNYCISSRERLRFPQSFNLYRYKQWEIEENGDSIYDGKTITMIVYTGKDTLGDNVEKYDIYFEDKYIYDDTIYWDYYRLSKDDLFQKYGTINDYQMFEFVIDNLRPESIDTVFNIDDDISDDASIQKINEAVGSSRLP